MSNVVGGRDAARGGGGGGTLTVRALVPPVRVEDGVDGACGGYMLSGNSHSVVSS